MDSMLWVVLLLLFFLAVHFMPHRDNYENYDETSCIALATKNKDNIESLQKDIGKLLALQAQVQTVQNSTDANATQLKTLVSQVYNTPT